MKITLKSIGSAKLKPNYVKSNIDIRVTSEDYSSCSQILINTIGNLTEEFKKYIPNVVFLSYNLYESKKQVEEKKIEDGKEIRVVNSVFDCYVGTAYLSMKFDLDMKLLDYIDKSCKSMSNSSSTPDTHVFITGRHTYTLSDKSSSELKGSAVNNALDQMVEQVHKIAKHMGYTKVELKNVDLAPEYFNQEFEPVFKSAKCDTVENKDFTLEDLDKLLDLKEIEKDIEVLSTWELSK